MSSIVQWLNVNGGFVMAMLTAVYAATTLVMAWHMRRSNRLAADSLGQAVRLEAYRVRPYVVFDLESRRKIITAVLRNIGQTPAYDVKIDVVPALTHSDSLGNKELSLLTGTIRMIAPFREFTDVVDSGPEFYRRYNEPIFAGSISYEDGNGQEYEETFDVDMTFAATLLNVQPPPEVGTELKKLRELMRDWLRSQSD